jgi:eukaryotic-like serine/threonine-protein kinase
MSHCPDEESLIALAHGKIPGDARAQLMVHVDGCAACLDTLAVLMLEEESPATTGNASAAQVSFEGAQTKPVENPNAPPLQEPTDNAATYTSGQKLTPLLTIQGYLGGGGMGAVYKAYHAGFGKQVAVKVLKQDTHSSAAKTRLFREARALSELPPSHVVRVYDVSELPTGEPYVVMDLLVGSNLRDWFEKTGPMPVGDALMILVAICTAVASAHERGIVHRDLKPENIFRLNDGTIRILDFGLSKLDASMLNEQDSTLTRSNAFLGTPLYVAPEQVREATRVDTRADVWALGVVLYEALTGTTPFRRKTVGAVLAAVLSEPAAPVRKLRGDAPESLEQLVATCLALDPNKRPRDAGALAALIERERLALLEARELLALQTTEPLVPKSPTLTDATGSSPMHPARDADMTTAATDSRGSPEARTNRLPADHDPSASRSSMGTLVAASSPEREPLAMTRAARKTSRSAVAAAVAVSLASLTAGGLLLRQKSLGSSLGPPASETPRANPGAASGANAGSAPGPTLAAPNATATIAEPLASAPYTHSEASSIAGKSSGNRSQATGAAVTSLARSPSAGGLIQVVSKDSAARSSDGNSPAPSAPSSATAAPTTATATTASASGPNREFGQRK